MSHSLEFPTKRGHSVNNFSVWEAAFETHLVLSPCGMTWLLGFFMLTHRNALSNLWVEEAVYFTMPPERKGAEDPG